MADKPLPEGTDAVIEDALPEDLAGDTIDGDGVPDAPSAEEGGAAIAAAPEEPAEPEAEPADAAPDAAGGATGAAKSTADQLREKATSFRGEATDRIYGVAQQGKDRTVAALDNVTRLIEEAAAQIDQQAGIQYGDYARRASDAVQGLTTTLREKEIDDLVADAREAVKKSPAIAIGAAAALGFVVARLVKAGAATFAEPEPADAEPKAKASGGRKAA